MPSLVDHEHFFLEARFRILGLHHQTSDWHGGNPNDVPARALNDDGAPELSFMLLATSFRNLFKPNQRAKLLGFTFQENVFKDISNCGVQ